ncbi:RING/U-box superfamily protein [Actinidia rufa]|uniref:RING-type E3 ubiquitin transferase n=1 Tax=Actinidia rufa TaxID=165716 RepID=A0A7J0DIT7_9ERIC|nr:RING/U-box superfamily protein [Actinidia rufa]
MNWVFSEIKEQSSLSPSYFLSPPPPPADFQTIGFDFSTKVSPSILLTIIVLAIIFFLCGLLHLLVRFRSSPQNRDPNDLETVSAFQGQLQQLFHLHDAGVDQSFIDSLPIFNYKAVIGVKDPFDCAVCLCEFEPEDCLRLLPKCSHAFHMDCIDTWLLSHSTCPLCRGSLLSDFPQNSCFSPIVLVLEAGSESARENASDRDGVLGSFNSVPRANSHLGFHFGDELAQTHIDFSQKSCEIQPKNDEIEEKNVGSEEKVVFVKLGKFRNVDGGGGGEGEGGSTNNVNSRRCFSMGSFAYVMDENLSLQVPIRTTMKKQSSKKASHRLAMSECGCDSRRDFNGFEQFVGVDSGSIGNGSGSSNAIGSSKKESFSISKIWTRAEKEKPNPMAAADPSRRAFSFRFPVHRGVHTSDGGEDLKGKSGRWENGRVSENLGCHEENQSFNSLDSQPKTSSFARRTLLWLVGKQDKVVHSSFSCNL